MENWENNDKFLMANLFQNVFVNKIDYVIIAALPNILNFQKFKEFFIIDPIIMG